MTFADLLNFGQTLAIFILSMAVYLHIRNHHKED